MSDKRCSVFYIDGPGPYGFRIKGGRDLSYPITITNVTVGGKADKAGIEVNSQVISINDIDFTVIPHIEAANIVKNAEKLVIKLIPPIYTKLFSSRSYNELCHNKISHNITQNQNDDRQDSFVRNNNFRECKPWYREFKQFINVPKSRVIENKEILNENQVNPIENNNQENITDISKLDEYVKISPNFSFNNDSNIIDTSKIITIDENNDSVKFENSTNKISDNTMSLSSNYESFSNRTNEPIEISYRLNPQKEIYVENSHENCVYKNDNKEDFKQCLKEINSISKLKNNSNDKFSSNQIFEKISKKESVVIKKNYQEFQNQDEFIAINDNKCFNFDKPVLSSSTCSSIQSVKNFDERIEHLNALRKKNEDLIKEIMDRTNINIDYDKQQSIDIDSDFKNNNFLTKSIDVLKTIKNDNIDDHHNNKDSVDDSVSLEEIEYFDFTPSFAILTNDETTKDADDDNTVIPVIVPVVRKIFDDLYEVIYKGIIIRTSIRQLTFIKHKDYFTNKYVKPIIGIAIAIEQFKSKSNIVLSYKNNDHIIINSVIDDKWYEGQINNKIGIFHRKNFQFIDVPIPNIDISMSDVNFKSDKLSQDTDDNVVDHILFKCEANQNFDPKNKDEILLRIGHKINIIKYFSDGWGLGYNKDTQQYGMVPVFFTDLVC